MPRSRLRFFNQSLPQMLQIAVILLYIDAFLHFVGLFDPLPAMARLVLFVSVPLGVAGGYGISAERKWGYLCGVAAAFTPYVFRLVVVLWLGNGFVQLGLGDNIRYVLSLDDILTLIFEVALVVLLLHPKSRDHQRLWFR